MKNLLNIILIMAIIASSLLLGMSKSYAADPENQGNESNKTGIQDPITTVGGNILLVKLGETFPNDCVFSDVEEGRTFWILDTENLIPEISNPDVAKIEGNNVVAIGEGNCNIKFSYEYKGNMYTSKGQTYSVYKNVFEGVNTAIFLNKAKINLTDDKKTDDALVYVQALGSYLVEYPEGYNESNYYNFDWKVADESIAKVENAESELDFPSSKVAITGLKTGTTKVTCTVSSADGAESYEEVIDVEVKFTEPEEKSETPAEEKKAEENKVDNTTAKKPLAKTGESALLIGGAVVFAVVAIIIIKKKIDLGF